MDKEMLAALDALVESGKKTADAVAALVEAKGKEDKDKADALAEAARVAEEAGKPAEVDPLAVVAKLAESKLAPASQARVLEAVKGGKDLAEAITAEQDYVKEIAESAKVFLGNGSEELQEASGAAIGTSIYGV